MSGFISEIVRRIQYLFQRNRVDAELREEMDAHLAMIVTASETDPVSARQKLGNLTRWQEISREAWGWSWAASLVRDVRHGVRLLSKSPGFTVTACLSLAIGMGATLGIFSLMNALLFKTLPIPQPQQLWKLGHGNPAEQDDNFSYRMYAGLQKSKTSGIPLFALGGDYVQVDYGDAIRNNTAALIVSGNLFQILKLNAPIGRLLNPQDDIRGLPHGANCVLSHRLWQSQFHSDPAALGKHLTIGAQSFTIVGVAPSNFFGFYVGAYSDLILPIAAFAATNPAQPILDNGGWTWLNIMARIPPSGSISELTARLNAIYPPIRRAVDPSPSEAAKPDRLYLESATTGVSAIRGHFSKPLYVLLTMTGLILLIACANLANLLLARSVVRYRELAIRLSIGASRGRILRQLLTESALVAVLGTCAGVPIYLACTRGLIAFLQSGSNQILFLDTAPDWPFVVGILALLSLTVLLFGFAPAWQAIRTGLNTALSESSHRLAAKTSFGRVVVAVQISLSLVLLLGATLLSRSLFDLRTFNPGFRRDHLLIANVDTTQSIHKNADVVLFFDRLLEQVRTLPGVRSAAASVVVPLSGQTWQQNYEIVGKQAAHVQHSFEHWVTPDYFETLGTPLILGRNLAPTDSAKSFHVALVNQTFAKLAFGSSNPIGRQVYDKDEKDTITIVGIVGDARYRSLRADAPPTIYRPVSQLPSAFGFLLALNLEVWTSTPPADLARPIEGIAKRLDSQASLEFHTFDSLIDANLLYERLLTVLSISFGLIGLFLSAIGVYGVSAYSVARRTSEVGIRMAMGATPRTILRLIFSEQLRVLAIGVVIGALISIAVTRFLRAWLFGVSATDPFLFTLAVLIVSALALFAAFIPARRAARLNPVAALRSE
ncbi:MAG: ABC transporter permease [Bryobacteraceae bacterium]